MKYLIVTNVISELRRGNNANRGVIEFFYDIKANNASSYLSVLAIGEIRRGIGMILHRGDTKQANALAEWLQTIVQNYSDFILPVDLEIAACCADLRVPHHENAIDKLIAATALLHSLQVVTRNTKDFDKSGVKTVNPFTD